MHDNCPELEYLACGAVIRCCAFLAAIIDLSDDMLVGLAHVGTGL